MLVKHQSTFVTVPFLVVPLVVYIFPPSESVQPDGVGVGVGVGVVVVPVPHLPLLHVFPVGQATDLEE